MTTFHVENFGCRATQADGGSIESQFEAHGVHRAEMAQADVVVLNTCTVTSAADQDARAAIRRVRRQNPSARIVVTGCYAQRVPGEVAALPGVSMVIGNSHKHRLAEIVLRPLGVRNPQFVPVSNLSRSHAAVPLFVSDIFAHTELVAARVFESSERTRPNLKVQDGCDNRCSFCVIPSVRGQSRSLALEDVLSEVRTLVAVGYKELVISGINLGRWGRDLPPQGRNAFPRFVDLLRNILNETGLEKLRISSVEPMDWIDELISLVASSARIAKHAHVPLQAGSDSVLRRMHRKYRPWHYQEKIEKIRAAMPTAAIGADVMVGFPGETDTEFEETRRFIEGLPLTYLHVFTFSARPGTAAATMPDQVPHHVARERNRILRVLGAEKKVSFMRSFLGKRVEAITLNHSAADCPDPAGGEHVFTEALTDNYQKLLLRGHFESNRWVSARLQEIVDSAFVGAA